MGAGCVVVFGRALNIRNGTTSWNSCSWCQHGHHVITGKLSIWRLWWDIEFCWFYIWLLEFWVCHAVCHYDITAWYSGLQWPIEIFTDYDVFLLTGDGFPYNVAMIWLVKPFNCAINRVTTINASIFHAQSLVSQHIVFATEYIWNLVFQMRVMILFS